MPFGGVFPRKNFEAKRKSRGSKRTARCRDRHKNNAKKGAIKKDRRDQAADRQAVQRRPPLRAAFDDFLFWFCGSAGRVLVCGGVSRRTCSRQAHALLPQGIIKG